MIRAVPLAVRTGVWLVICAACCVGCANRATPTALPASAPSVSPPIDRLFIYVRNWPTEEVELVLVRRPGNSTLTMYRPARDKRPPIMLESIGPGQPEPEMVSAMLASFDIWAMNDPDAPGAACWTVMGERSCHPTFKDYSLVMRVESGPEVRVQRYTRLEKSTSSRSARALGDFVLEWARKRERGEKHP